MYNQNKKIMKNRVIVFQQDNKQVIKEGNFFFTSITEDGETFESGDFKSLRRAKESLGIVPTIQETNRLLAKFLGRNGKVNKSLYSWEGIDSLLTGGWVEVKAMKFHSDWNWLMQVVEKIESLGYKVNNFSINNYIYIGKDDVVSVIINEPNLTKKEAFYQAVVKFVNWYNENK